MSGDWQKSLMTGPKMALCASTKYNRAAGMYRNMQLCLVQFPFSRVSYCASTKHNSAVSQRMSSRAVHMCEPSILSRARGGAGGDTEGDDDAAWGALGTKHLG